MSKLKTFLTDSQPEEYVLKILVYLSLNVLIKRFLQKIECTPTGTSYSWCGHPANQPLLNKLGMSVAYHKFSSAYRTSRWIIYFSLANNIEKFFNIILIKLLEANVFRGVFRGELKFMTGQMFPQA